MTQARLPDGFAVQVDRRVRVLGDGSALLGGSPTRLLRLAPAAQDLLSDGRLKVRDEVSAQLARTLLDATVAHPRPAGGPSHRDVTVVIPVRDNTCGVRRLVSSLRGLRVIVVDDGSTCPIEPEDFIGAHCDIEVLRHPRSKGPGAARNTGLAACTTDFVAFLDSDVAPRRGWLEALLGHFCDPTVALVAPRIIGLSQSENAVARYEAVHSSLDLGQREAPVLPHSTVSYVPSAAIICRRSAIHEVGGFDETLQSGEDVDLCWRLIEAGARLRYEPIALVAHDHRTELRDWLARKAFMAGPRHRCRCVARPTRPGGDLRLGADGLDPDGARDEHRSAGLAAGRLPDRSPDRQGHARPRDFVTRCRRVATRGLWSAALQLASAICRHLWPLALVAAILSRHCRRVVVVAASSTAWSTGSAAGMPPVTMPNRSDC